MRLFIVAASAVFIGALSCRPALGGDTFAPQLVITGLSDPHNISAVDLNGDGLDDIAVANQANHDFVRYLSLPGGGFGPPQNYWVATTYTVDIVCADLNGDHIPDAAVTCLDNYVAVFPGLGTGDFGARKTYSVGSAPYAIAASDFNVDGRMDLVTANHAADSISVLSQLADGTFSRREYSVGGAPWDLATADLNHDGRPDLLVSNERSPYVTVFYSQADGSLGGRLDVDMGANGYLALVAADFNGDGLADIASVNEFTSVLGVRYGLPGGGFGNGKTFPTGMGPTNMEAADFNGDGLIDLALSASSEYSTRMGVLYGLPGGDFSAVDSYDVGRYPRGLGVGDFNGDGRPDVAVSNNRTDTISVLYNITPEPASLLLLALGSVAVFRRRGCPGILGYALRRRNSATVPNISNIAEQGSGTRSK